MSDQPKPCPYCGSAVKAVARPGEVSLSGEREVFWMGSCTNATCITKERDEDRALGVPRWLPLGD